MNDDVFPIDPIAELQREVAELRRRLDGFRPVTVDLRINGTVRPVVLFALDDTPAAPLFSVVSPPFTQDSQ